MMSSVAEREGNVITKMKPEVSVGGRDQTCHLVLWGAVKHEAMLCSVNLWSCLCSMITSVCW